MVTRLVPLRAASAAWVSALLAAGRAQLARGAPLYRIRYNDITYDLRAGNPRHAESAPAGSLTGPRAGA